MLGYFITFSAVVNRNLWKNRTVYRYPSSPGGAARARFVGADAHIGPLASACMAVCRPHRPPSRRRAACPHAATVPGALFSGPRWLRRPGNGGVWAPRPTGAVGDAAYGQAARFSCRGQRGLSQNSSSPERCTKTWRGKCERGGLEPLSRSISRPQASQNGELYFSIRHFDRACCKMQHALSRSAGGDQNRQ